MQQAPLIAVSHFLNTALKDLRERPLADKRHEAALSQVDALISQAIQLVTPLVQRETEYIPYHGPRELGFADARTASPPRSETGRPPSSSPHQPSGGEGGGAGGRRPGSDRAKTGGPKEWTFAADLDLLK